MTPTRDDLWFLPLGGCGEIGMNLNLFGHDGRWLMVDCGITFEQAREPGGRTRIQMADPAFIAARREQLVGLIATHAHEDHIGAIPHLWSQLRVPVFTTPFTAAVLRRKARARRGEAPSPLIETAAGESHSIGPFRVTWLPITHSTPETCALLIETPAGTVLHTADWKIDAAPVTGDAFSASLYQRIGNAGIDAVVCDSTNATRPGSSVSEGALRSGIDSVLEGCRGRVVVACFASNIARLRTLFAAARACGRYPGLLGRSLQTMASCALGTGYLEPAEAAIDAAHLAYLPPHEVFAVATGSQGEAGAALQRLAADSHPLLNLERGDTVIFSARTIPGNEPAVARLTQRFKDRGIAVVHADESQQQLHASGHPCADELAQMYRWLAPRIAVPVHGEARHMRANAAIARAQGVAVPLTGCNGDLFYLAPQPGIRRGAAGVGRLELDADEKPVPVACP